uniref:RRM domain-containing protein n=1 Tax=Rhabditophanes sp. KR3021 TaxID=114890 RepID=A0AC35UA28_9BILA
MSKNSHQLIPNEPPFKVYVGNLPHDTIEGDFDDIFVDCQKVEIRMVHDKETNVFKGFAYVEFRTRECLLKALEKDNCDFDGNILKVDLAFNKTRDNQRGGRGGPRDGGSRGYGSRQDGGNRSDRGNRPDFNNRPDNRQDYGNRQDNRQDARPYDGGYRNEGQTRGSNFRGGDRQFGNNRDSRGFGGHTSYNNRGQDRNEQSNSGWVQAKNSGNRRQSHNSANYEPIGSTGPEVERPRIHLAPKTTDPEELARIKARDDEERAARMAKIFGKVAIKE